MLCRFGSPRPKWKPGCVVEMGGRGRTLGAFRLQGVSGPVPKRLTGPLLRLIAQLTGLRLHVLWHRPLDFQEPGEMPVLCPRARQRAGANGRQPKCCESCLRRRWKPALSPANQGRRFIGQCGATNFCACLQVDKVCPLTLVLQARVAPRSSACGQSRIRVTASADEVSGGSRVAERRLRAT